MEEDEGDEYEHDEGDDEGEVEEEDGVDDDDEQKENADRKVWVKEEVRDGSSDDEEGGDDPSAPSTSRRKRKGPPDDGLVKIRVEVTGEINQKAYNVNKTHVMGEFLGKPKHRPRKKGEEAEVGVATGLAWTEFGGELLETEIGVMRGKGKLTLTGQLGDVMQESARAAVSYLRSRADLLGVDPDFNENYDLHVHVPEGAIPKDGPSAGITMATSLISALTELPVRKDLAMTGEVTLRGKVLPVGGIKDKVLAAFRAGITEVILPHENEKDLEDIPEEVREVLEIHLVESMDDVLRLALEGEITPLPQADGKLAEAGKEPSSSSDGLAH